MLPKLSDWFQALPLGAFTLGWAFLQKWLWQEQIQYFAFFLLNPLGHPWLTINLLVLPIMALCYSHWFLFGKEGTGFPAWLPSPDSWIYATLQWTTAVISFSLATFLVGGVIYLIRPEFPSDPQAGFYALVGGSWLIIFFYSLALGAKLRRLLKRRKPPAP